MLTALILICSAAVTPDLRDCTPDNATAEAVRKKFLAMIERLG